jgi:transposase
MRYGALSKLIVLPEKQGERKLNAVEYVEEIMDKELFDFWIESMEDVGYVQIMEDGAPYHMGVATARRKQYEEDGWEGWGPGTWPSSSPDLNPIENLWHILRSKIRKRRPKILKKEDLMCALVEEWEKLDVEIINHLIDSMPRRLQAVIDAKGGSTKY